MPELPEVETIRRGLSPLLCGARIDQLLVRNRQLRWPIPRGLGELLAGRSIDRVERRAKYLLLTCGDGTLLIHLGMSGSLRVIPAATPVGKHDHFDLRLADGQVLRFNDPRRFGALLWCTGDPAHHPLLAGLGPEPFERRFDGEYLAERAGNRKLAVKSLLMDQKVVVGVGNIYASEALFRSGIDPRRPAGTVARASYRRLAAAVRDVLAEAIAAGGTTLRDFQNAHGQPGYFAVQLQVYGREGEPCPVCHTLLRCERVGQRSSYFCPRCQH